MQKIKIGLFALGALMTLGVAGATAQNGALDGQRAMRAGGGGNGIERIMSLRERLELSDDQVAQLDGIRRTNVARRSAEQAEMAEMRSQLQAGQIRQSDMMAFLEERRDAAPAAREGVQEQVESILTEDQLESLGELQARGRAFVQGRASARRGASARGQRGTRGPSGFRGQRGINRRAPGWNRDFRGRN